MLQLIPVYGARSPPPLQHPRPQHPPSQIPSTSPPPPDFGDSQAGYQRFSSPPVLSPNQQQQQHYQRHGQQHGGGGGGPATFHAYGAQDHYLAPGTGYASPAGGNSPQQDSAHSGFQPWMADGGGGGGWPLGGMNDATAQMGMQFGKHAFDAGQAYIDKNITRMVPLAHLKHSFNVSNGYVLTKLRLVLFPWTHRPWSRSLQRSETTGAAEGYKPPREDVNCPDLYIPVMSLVTYILLAAIYAGKQGQFDPQILGQTASKAFGILFLEFCCIKLGCYLLGIGEEGTMVDLLAYEGYKFVGVIVTLLAGLLGLSGWVFWLVFLYTLFANFFFQLRSLRHIILPDPAMSPLDHATAANSGANAHSHAARSRRIQFLFIIALAQALSMGVLVRV